MKCFYHDDLDGRAAAFCVHAWVGIRGCPSNNIDIDFIPMDYGRIYDFDLIRAAEQVWIVDFSFKPDDMRRILSATNDVTWIDHHKTAIDALKDFNIRGLRRIGESGCELAWKYIHWYTARGNGPERFEGGDPMPLHGPDDMPMPTVIKVVGDWDTWRHEKLSAEKQEEVLNFCAAAKIHETDPSSKFWWMCMDKDVEPLPPPNTGNAKARRNGEAFWRQLMDEGWVIRRYDDKRNEEMRNAIGFATVIDGHSCFAMNKARTNSLAMGGDEMLSKYEILVPFYFDGKRFTVSLYSKTVDVSEIAKKRGGGGHKGAAGFQCDSVEWMIKPATPAPGKEGGHES